MTPRAATGKTIVVDIGKTNAKASLWNESGELIARKLRSNEVWQSISGYRSLDVSGIDTWLIESLNEFAAFGDVARIIPVGHGAAAALIRDGKLFADPMDYEQNITGRLRAEYNSGRDPFRFTGSPALPQALNLGVQFHLLEELLGVLPDDVTILPWPQYWAWRLSGELSSEVTSLGCHTDLWRPAEGTFSDLAVRRGWAQRMAPLRHAGDVLGPITDEIAAVTGLNTDCEVLVGLHDSNAALLAARGLQEIADAEATVLSTGTWFIAMRSAAKGADVDIRALDESRDCLVNVDVDAQPIPSARFMGGREAELAGGENTFELTDSFDTDELVDRLPELLQHEVLATPGFVRGVGPFPCDTGTWHKCPSDPVGRRVATDLYLALVADTSLNLMGSTERLLVEGRFAEDVVFVRALASLRPGQRVYTSNAAHDVAYGALRLVAPDLAPPTSLTSIDPFDFDLGAYASTWRERATASPEAK